MYHLGEKKPCADFMILICTFIEITFLRNMIRYISFFFFKTALDLCLVVCIITRFLHHIQTWAWVEGGADTYNVYTCGFPKVFKIRIHYFERGK